MEFFDSIKQIKTNWQPYKKWEAEQNDKDFRREALYKKHPASKEELEHASQYGRTIVDAINVMDQYSIDKSEDVELATQSIFGVFNMGVAGAGLALGKLLTTVPSIKNKLAKMPKTSIVPTAVLFGPMLLASIIVTPFFMIKSKSYEKEASRVARYQAREKELKDYRHFVVYDKNQIVQAKEIAKTLPDITDKKKKSLNPVSGFSDSIKSIKSLKRDHDSYLQWKQEHSKAEKARMEALQNADISPEQLKHAKHDQDNLLRTIRKIEVYSQNYLSNVEMALNSVLGLDLVMGAAGGGLASGAIHLLQKTKIFSPESKKLNALKRLMPIAAPFVLILTTAFYSVKACKEAAKIGRYKAKQELLNNPHNFITYSDEQSDSVKELKAPKTKDKSFFGKLKEDIRFFLQLIKDLKTYNKYQKTAAKEEQKLDKALMQVEISATQKQEAESLQKNSFKAFEKMDEMTQRYSDDTEAATTISKQIVNTFISLGSGALAIGLLANKRIEAMKSEMTKLAIVGLPVVVGVISQIGMEIKSVQIKKQAGKIGIMEAMQDLDDPKIFINDVVKQ